MSEASRIDPARFNMVQQQIRPWGVVDDRVLDVMARVPRESFVPDAYRSLAYADIEVPLSDGRTMLAPKIVARMLQALRVQPGERALEIGTGSGYLAACLAGLGACVLGLETDAELAEQARARLAETIGQALEVRVGNGLAGPVAGGPFDAIAVNGTLPNAEPLAALEQQLAMNGRMFAIIGRPPVMAATCVVRVGQDAFRRETLFETSSSGCSMVPAAPAFVF